jgi:hypothetical protein
MSLEESASGSEHLESHDTNLEEDQILELLSKLRLDLFRIETTTGPSRRTVCIRDDIKSLEMQLADCKGQAK